uniref:Uncharacterized protein n=1 Tax=Meloidogyne javanica TaxID=6303 RepID=A0A915LMT3_MELJA
MSKLAILLLLMLILFEMLECVNEGKDKDLSDSSGKEEETDSKDHSGNVRSVSGQRQSADSSGAIQSSTIQNQHVNPNDQGMEMLGPKQQKRQIKKLQKDLKKLDKDQHKIRKDQKDIKKKMLKISTLAKECEHDSKKLLELRKQNMKKLKEIFERNIIRIFNNFDKFTNRGQLQIENKSFNETLHLPLKEEIKTTKASYQTDEQLTKPKRVKEETLTIRDPQDIQKIKTEHVEGKGKGVLSQDGKHQPMFEGLPPAQMTSSSQFASMQRPYRPYLHAESSGMQSNPGSPSTNLGDNIKQEEIKSHEDVDESE